MGHLGRISIQEPLMGEHCFKVVPSLFANYDLVTSGPRIVRSLGTRFTYTRVSFRWTSNLTRKLILLALLCCILLWVSKRELHSILLMYIELNICILVCNILCQVYDWNAWWGHLTTYVQDCITNDLESRLVAKSRISYINSSWRSIQREQHLSRTFQILIPCLMTGNWS